MSDDIRKLISAGISGTESGQKDLADNIPALLKRLEPSLVRDQLIPFLCTWMPYNNTPAIVSISFHRSELANAAGGLKPISSLIQCLISTELPEVESSIAASLVTYKGDSMLEELISSLLTTHFDFVRAWLVKLLPLVQNESFVRRTLHSLATDTAHMVRYAVAKVLPKTHVSVSEEISQILVKDKQGRIRAFLAHSLFDQPYYFTFAGRLATDSDWSVRATVATALGKTQNLQQAASLCEELIDDGVWQVRTCALRSLTRILTDHPEFSFELSVNLVDLLDEPRNPHRFAVIDCLFAQRTVSQDLMCRIVGKIGREPGEVKLKFLEACQARNLTGLLRETLNVTVRELYRDPKWRVRFGVISILGKLAGAVEDSTVAAEFMNICQEALDDTAFPVRDAALEQLAADYVKEGDEIPAFVQELERMQSYRKRQAAICLLGKMRRMTTSDTLRAKIQAELEGLAEDPVHNVALTAKHVLANK